VPIIGPNLEPPYDKIPLQGSNIIHIEIVPVCFLSAPPIEMPETEPPTINLDSIIEHLGSLRDHINATQKYEIDVIVDHYRSLETEINDFRRQGTERNMGFTKRAKKRVDALLREAIRIMQLKSNEMKALQMQRAATQNRVLIAQIEQKINDLIDINKELEAMFRELNILAGSTQVYDIENRDAGLDPVYITGSHEYDITNNRVVIKALNDMSLLAHELKHAYQFERSGLSIATNRNHHFIYDKYDELEAYKRGAIFGGTSYSTIRQLPTRYAPLPETQYNVYNHQWTETRINIADPRRISQLQSVANKWRVIFRINGMTYIPR
jgi:hypothetical protein